MLCSGGRETPAGQLTSAWMGPAWSSQSHQRDFAFASVCSTVALGLNQVCLEFAESLGTAPVKPEEEQPIAWKRQSVSTASLGSHIFGTLEQQQPCFACQSPQEADLGVPHLLPAPALGIRTFLGVGNTHLEGGIWHQPCFFTGTFSVV